MFISGKSAPNKINILYIIDVLRDWGGTEKHLYYLVKNLDRQRFNCAIASFDSTHILQKAILNEGIQVYPIPVARYYTPNAFIKALELRRIIKKKRIHIVQTFHFKADTYGVLVSKLSGVRHIVSSQRDLGDTKKIWHKIMNRIINRFINKFIAVCDAVSKRIAENENIPESKMKTIYNGIELDSFTVPNDEHIAELKNQYRLAEENFVIGMVANFRPEKNHGILLSAAKILKNEIKDLKILCIGEGPTLSEYKEYCERNDMNHFVLFTGAVNDVRNYIAMMDVACLVPGTNEGFSNAILEKMAMGKPLIVTDIGGNPEEVLDGKNGIVIPPMENRNLLLH